MQRVGVPVRALRSSVHLRQVEPGASAASAGRGGRAVGPAPVALHGPQAGARGCHAGYTVLC